MYNDVADTPFFKDIINEESREFISAKFRERTFPKGHILYFQDDPGHAMYVIKTGILKIYRQEDDQEIVLGHQFPGEVIGELELFHHDNHRTASVATLDKVMVWEIRREQMDEIVRVYPDLMRKVIYILSERLIQADRKIEYLAFLDVRVRAANLLLDLVSNFGKKTSNGLLIDWRITQQHFGSMIGVGRETASKALNDFKNEKLIHMDHRKVYVIDLEGLQGVANANQDPVEKRVWHSTHKYHIPSL
ncbi:Crp/Fnr family transcriptional regulator [Paenibacillus barcinonensis]|uniref:CRP/FNR family transcriptional regulator n=1 Tax=Paenibacillus barcinonensis TaxID=198119 RepID=A0A2V4VA20_PAEBA|nr:Crp/Fnr family transcriptional regulator [Paenibacillus barcinonensis]PYE49765.1 CRP/FNR family transcriptional regulator [Paenibacillus barcinonensis]QKS56545.1 Crp/Fnr family transcriptional regulator [Paenibacillus barcinonensis]